MFRSVGALVRRAPRQSYGLAVSLVAFVALACGQSAISSSQSEPASSPMPTATARAIEEPTPIPASVDLGNLSVLTKPSGPPPQVDITVAGVPPEEVYFDTFDGGFKRLSDADAGTIERLRDRIRPIYKPKYDSVEGGD